MKNAILSEEKLTKEQMSKVRGGDSSTPSKPTPR